jgi:hypothetical protein
MRCTVPKCRAGLYGTTGFQELLRIRQHFFKHHNVDLTTEEALEVRVSIERGEEPNILRAMLGTERISKKEAK